MAFVNPDTSVLKSKKLYIFDMDGTIYLGSEVFSFAVDFIDRLRKSGRRVLFFTNNASHSKEHYINKLTRLGFSPSESEIMTSGDVTAEFINRHRKGRSVYIVGTDDLVDSFKKYGINVLSGEEPRADIVLTSFDTSLTYEKLEKACRYIRNGAEYLSTHPDFNCPTENGFIPDSGAISAFVTASTGVAPKYFGKPYRETVEMIAEAEGLGFEDMCVFGDRLYTDIAVGKKYGITSVLVYTGETTHADVEKAADSEKPDFAFESLAFVDKEIFG